MRIATMVVSLVLMLVVGVQSCTLATAAEIGQDEELSGAAGFGLFVALLFLVGGAFALGLPRLSAGAFALAALIAFPAGLTSEFEDLVVWGVAAVVLAVMAWFGHREKRRRDGSPGDVPNKEESDGE